jgi:hypothetical protein
MLQKVGFVIKGCLEHALRTKQAAEMAVPALRVDFLRLEKSWLALAQSEEVTERLGRLCNERRRAMGALRSASLIEEMTEVATAR